MTDSAAFTGSIPELYDRHLRSLLFDPYAADLAARVKGARPRAVLETACGTGILTRRLRKALPAQATLVASDLSPAMLTFAAASMGADAAGVEWRSADMAELPFPDAAFTLVVTQFGLMFVPEPAAAAREAHRVLRPGGRWLLNVWDALEQNPFVALVHATVAAFYPVDPPAFYRIPFGMHDEERLRDLLAGAGFIAVTTDRIALEGTSPSAAAAAQGIVCGTPAIMGIRDRGTVPEATVLEAVTEAIRGAYGPGPIRIPLRALVVDAVAG